MITSIEELFQVKFTFAFENCSNGLLLCIVFVEHFLCMSLVDGLINKFNYNDNVTIC